MTEAKDYQEVINKFNVFDKDPIQFYININTTKLNKEDEKCAICLENNITIKINCCEGYFHNSCLYSTIKYKNTKIQLEYKFIKYLDQGKEILTNNINEICPICRQCLNNCDIKKPQTNTQTNTQSIPRFGSFSTTIDFRNIPQPSIFGTAPRNSNTHSSTRFGTIPRNTTTNTNTSTGFGFGNTTRNTPSANTGFGSISRSTNTNANVTGGFGSMPVNTSTRFTFGSFPSIENNNSSERSFTFN